MSRYSHRFGGCLTTPDYVSSCTHPRFSLDHGRGVRRLSSQPSSLLRNFSYVLRSMMGTCLFSSDTVGSDGADFHSCYGNDGGDIFFFHCTQASIGSMYWESFLYQRDDGGFSYLLWRYGDTMIDSSMGGSLRIEIQTNFNEPVFHAVVI